MFYKIFLIFWRVKTKGGIFFEHLDKVSRCPWVLTNSLGGVRKNESFGYGEMKSVLNGDLH